MWAGFGPTESSFSSDAEFVVPFFSSSRPLALKMSLQSHQMTIFCIQDEYWENDDVILVKSSLFWMRKVVICWLFDDELRARVREQEKKRTINSTSKGQLKVNNWNFFVFLLGFNPAKNLGYFEKSYYHASIMHTVFPRIVSAETILFWMCRM